MQFLKNRSPEEESRTSIARAGVREKRDDIQLLRAWAVALVLLHHASLPAIRAGYLGVDIFFVISGFLMTRIIAGEISSNTFSFRSFYFRRAKRLLPASLAVIGLCIVAAEIFMTGDVYADFMHTVFGALTFTTNLVLKSQSGYFDVGAEYAPLLHYWSLAVEEQYYFVIPIALVLCPARYWKWTVPAATVASFALCMFIVQRSATTAFYLLPTRAWEMGIGSFAALIAASPQAMNIARRLFWPSIALLIAVPLLGIGSALSLPHPGVESLVVCLATMAVLLAAKQVTYQGRLLSAARGVGDASYSLYLAHWPFFAFAHMASPGGLALPVRLALLGAGLVAGFLLHVAIERPIHRARIPLRGRFVTRLALSSILLGAVADATAALTPGALDAVSSKRGNVGLSRACEGDISSDAWLRECRSSPHPKVLLWGDSHAMHIAAALAKQVDGGIIQATKPACPPLLDLSWYDSGLSEGYAKECLEFNGRVLELIKNEPSVEIVVIASALHAFFLNDVHAYSPSRGSTAVSADDVAAALASSVSELRHLGKRVVFVQSPPSAEFDVGQCWHRKELGLPLFGPNASCEIPLQMAQSRSKEVTSIVARLAHDIALPSINLADALCSGTLCRTTVDGHNVYLDNSHLSVAGAAALSKKIHLGRQIEQLAN